MLQKRPRILVFDTAIDACRMLPEWGQVVVFVGSILGFQLFFFPIFSNFLLTIIVLQILFLLILLQKNIYFRRISKIENAIRYQIIWIKTKRDQEQIERYKLFGSLMFILGFLFYWSQLSWKLSMVIGLTAMLYMGKGIFFVPLVRIKMDADKKIEFSNDITAKSFIGNQYSIKQIQVEQQGLKVKSFKESYYFEIDFLDFNERKRTQLFLEGLWGKEE